MFVIKANIREQNIKLENCIHGRASFNKFNVILDGIYYLNLYPMTLDQESSSVGEDENSVGKAINRYKPESQ